MFEFGRRLQEHLREKFPKVEVFVHGSVFRQMALGLEPSAVHVDYLVVVGRYKRLTPEYLREVVVQLGGHPTYVCLYPSRRAYLATRHFTVDQGALDLEGNVAFATSACLKDLKAMILRPTTWAKKQDPARRDWKFSATLCGRAVRLAQAGFKPVQSLARYIRDNLGSLRESSSFRWHATKSDAALRDGASGCQSLNTLSPS